ncbi:MAG: hypothetical protein JNK35_13440 [Phycisphaerae bacterium]|nr:hypothetical protein [Phycisphaerae bacterium]
MGTSQKTLDQVKSILGKLDRSIDDARQRRLGDPARPVGQASGVAPALSHNPIGIAPNLNTTIPGPAGLAAPATPNGTIPPGTLLGAPGTLPAAPATKSIYGRAQPIRPEARSA